MFRKKIREVRFYKLHYIVIRRRRENQNWTRRTDGDRVSPGTDMQCRGTGVRVLTVRRFLLASTRKSIIHNSLAPNPAGGNRPPAHEEDLWTDDGGGVLLLMGGSDEGGTGTWKINDRFDSTHTYIIYINAYILYGDKAIRYVFYSWDGGAGGREFDGVIGGGSCGGGWIWVR